MKQDIQTLIRDLSQQLGLPTLSLDEGGCCGLEFDHNMHAELRYVERADVFNLLLEIGDLPLEESGAALRWFAAANLDPGSLGGCYFALDCQTRKVDLCRTLDAQELSSAELLEAIRLLVGIGKKWRASAGHELQVQTA